MGLRYPIPLGGIFNQILGLFCMILSIWFQMPKAWRMVASFKKRVKWMIVFHLTGVAISALYWVLWVVMAYVPADYQPIMAVVIPLFREALVETLKSIGNVCFCLPRFNLQPFSLCSAPHCGKSGRLC